MLLMVHNRIVLKIWSSGTPRTLVREHVNFPRDVVMYFRRCTVEHMSQDRGHIEEHYRQQHASTFCPSSEARVLLTLFNTLFAEFCHDTFIPFQTPTQLSLDRRCLTKKTRVPLKHRAAARGCKSERMLRCVIKPEVLTMRNHCGGSLHLRL